MVIEAIEVAAPQLAWMSDILRTHKHKHLDNIPDGPTYGRVLGTRINVGRATIDFSEAIHSNQNLDHMPDGTRAAWDSTTQKAAAVDSGGNILLKNLLGVVGSTTNPATTSLTYSVIPEMTQTLTTKGNKVLIIFTATMLAPFQGGFISIFKDGTQLTTDFEMASVVNGVDSVELVGLSFLDSPTAASHTYDVRYKAVNAAHPFGASGTARTLQTVELG